jgi:hypothetical protein
MIASSSIPFSISFSQGEAYTFIDNIIKEFQHKLQESE